MKQKRSGFIELAMRSNNIVIIITVVLIIVGVVALVKMPRNEFPQFTIRQGVVVGVYPGATSAEVENQLTRVVENYIFGYQEVKKEKTFSYSREGIMYIFVELNDDVKNADKFWSKLRHGLNELKMTLPSGVMALIANSDFGDTSALLITLSSDTHSYKELEEQLEKLEAGFRKLPASSKIKHFGLQKEKIFVNVKPEKLNEYNIKTISLLGSYQANGMVNYAGNVKDKSNNLAVHLPPNFESEKDLADQIVYSDPQGNVVRLKDIATVDRRYDEPDNYIRQNGKKTILLSLEMQPGNNIVEYGREVDEVLENFERTCPDGIDVEKISELPKYVDDSVSNFMKEFLIAIIAVILVTMILLPFRVASVAGITIPISVLVSLGVLYFIGVELNTVSLAALIIVLGMIVDNSIVVIDNHVEKIDGGGSVWHAAIKSAKQLFIPVVTATLAICAAYIPLGFMLPGTAGEFVAPLPLVIGIALAVSVAVAVLLVPYLNFVFIKKGLKNKKKKNKSFLDRLQGGFDFTLEKAFRNPAIVVIGGLIVLISSFALFKTVDQQLFPEMERNQFAVEVYLPTGSSLESTSHVIDSLESVLIKDARITNVTSFIGTSSPRFHTVYAPNMPAPNYGQLLINTTSNEATRDVVEEYREKYSDQFKDAHVRWKILALQNFKSPIEIRISSDSIKDIREVEARVYEILKNTENLDWIRTDWDQPLQSIRVDLDRDKANRLGFSKGFVATSLMAGIDGMPLTTIWEGGYPVDVVLQQENTSDNVIQSLEDMTITSPKTFSAVPLRSIATLSPEWTEGTIARRNGVKTLTILAENEPGSITSNIFAGIKPQIDKLELPEGTTISYGGEHEGQIEAFIPMAIALGVSIILIFFILLFQFKREKLSLLIMATMLLGIPGAAIGLKLIGYPFSLTAFIGITSLCGMTVRNGIILIDYAQELREKHKMKVSEAALAAGKRRMRPIFLTSAAAAVGVIPMILSRSPLWGPLGTVICFGLLISMILTLYILPVLYSKIYSDKPKKKGPGSIPSKKIRNAVIPAIIFFSLISVDLDAQRELGLDSCKYMALENNRKIKEAEMDVQISRQHKKEAFTNYFPKVSVSALAMRSAEYLIEGGIPETNLPVWNGMDPTMIQNPTQLTYIPEMSIGLLDYMNNLSASISLPLYAGGRIRNGNRLAKLGEEVSNYKKEITTDEILIKTEELFWNLQSLKEKEKTIRSYQKMLDSLHRDVNNYTQAGLAQHNDLLKIQLKQNELKANYNKLQNGIELMKRALCQHIGVEYDSLLSFSNSVELQDNSIEMSDPVQLIENRTEYQLLNKVVEIQKLQKKMALGEYMPQLAVVGMGFTYDAMEETNSNALAMVSLSIPITDWWGGHHKLKSQTIEVEKAKSSLTENTELMVLQIRQVENEVLETLYQIEISEVSIEQAKENLKISEDNYKAGVIGISDLLEAQAIYQQALDSLIEAQCLYQTKIARYKLVTGSY